MGQNMGLSWPEVAWNGTKHADGIEARNRNGDEHSDVTKYLRHLPGYQMFFPIIISLNALCPVSGS